MPTRPDGGNDRERPATRMSYLVKAHWRDEHNRHFAAPVIDLSGAEGEEATAACREAWAEFHHACGQVPLGSSDYTVDLMEQKFRLVPTEKGPGFYQRDGQERHIGNSRSRDGVVSGADLRRISRADIAGLQSLARSKHIDSGRPLGDPCTTCGAFSKDLRYSPDGLPYCAGHLPADVSPQEAL